MRKRKSKRGNKTNKTNKVNFILLFALAALFVLAVWGIQAARNMGDKKNTSYLETALVANSQSFNVCPWTSDEAKGKYVINFQSSNAQGGIIHDGKRKIISSGYYSNLPNKDSAHYISLGNLNIPQGTYKVQGHAFDSYSGRENVTQPEEQFQVMLKGSGQELASSNFINDIPDYVTTGWQTNELGKVTIAKDATEVMALHKVSFDKIKAGWTQPNSLVPVCALLEKESSGVCGNNFTADYRFGKITYPPSTEIIPINAKFETILTLKANGEDVVKEGQNIDLMIIMDRSGSMGQTTGGARKIDKAKEAMNKVVDLFQKTNNPTNRLGLVSFSDTVTLNQSLTSDYGSARNAIGAIQPDGWTNIGGALVSASSHMTTFGNSDSKKFFILATDGAHNIGTPVQTGIDSVPKNVAVYAIGVGKDTEYNPDVLRSVSLAGNGQGKYYESDVKDLVGIFEAIVKDIITPFRPEKIKVDFYRDDSTVDKFSLKSTDPSSTSSGGKISWSDLGSMINGESKELKINFGQDSGYGLGLPVNKKALEISYKLFGEDCAEIINAPVLTIDNYAHCIGEQPQHATICSEAGENNPLVDTDIKLVSEASSCTVERKCEYYCPDPYVLHNGKCKLKAACGPLSGKKWCFTFPEGVAQCSEGVPLQAPVAAGDEWKWLCGGSDYVAATCSASRLCASKWKEVTF